MLWDLQVDWHIVADQRAGDLVALIRDHRRKSDASTHVMDVKA